MTDHKKIVRVDVRGSDPALWARLRPKLLQAIEKALDSTLDHTQGTTVREEARQFTSAFLDYARNRLQREGLENDRIEAEVAKLYAERQSQLADADLRSAQAEDVRSRTALRELCKMLALTKAMLVGDQSDEAILFGQQIDSFLETIRSLNLLTDS
jgi:hypothetical protein